MAIGRDLQEALKSFAQVETEIIAFGRGADASKALEFVHMRKRMINEFAKLRDALESDPYFTVNEDRKTEVMRLFSAFRTQNAVNQANWPAIRVKDNLPEFRVAASAVGPFAQAFWGWIEKELGFRRPV